MERLRCHRVARRARAPTALPADTAAEGAAPVMAAARPVPIATAAAATRRTGERRRVVAGVALRTTRHRRHRYRLHRGRRGEVPRPPLSKMGRRSERLPLQ